MKTSSWTFRPFIPEQPPAFAPPRFSSGKRLDVSDFKSWNEVSALFLPLFQRATAIPADSPLRQEVLQIKAESAVPAERAALAVKLVQQKVRYVNLALGVGGLVPASADETWRRRFGDCKAKTALLVALLNELGIEARPVLVSTDNGDGLNERLPMVALFNHVIVQTVIDGKTHWLDGTRTGDSNLEVLQVPFYHWGLPIVPNARLVRIMPNPRTRPDIETVIHTDASSGVGAPVPTTLDLTMRGDLAIIQNAYFSQLDGTLRDQFIRKQLQGVLDRYEITKASTTYDDKGHVFRIHGEGRQTLDLNKGIYWTEVPSLGYKADFRRDGMRDAQAPVQLDFPYFTRNVQIIVVPKERVSSITFQMPPIARTVAGVEYRRTVTNAGGIVTIESTTRALVPEISIAEAIAAQDALRELDKDDIWIRLSNSTPVALPEIAEVIGHEPKTSADFLSAAMKFLRKQEAAHALGALDKALEFSPSAVGARSMRAQLRMSQGDVDGARADAIASLKADPKDVSTRRLLAGLHRQAGNSEAAYAEARALAAIDNAHAQLSRGEILLSLGRDQEALGAFDRALAIEPDPMTHAFRARAMSIGDTSGRRRELENGLKLNPSDAMSLSALAKLASQLGQHDRSLQLFDQAFLKMPDNVSIRHERAVAMMLAGKADAANREFESISSKELTAEELNELCWTKALANVALERALKECDKSLAKEDSAATRDSRGTVLLRQGRFDEAIKEYDLALAKREFASAFYGRALAYARKGDRARANVEAAKAMKLVPGIQRTYSHHGLTL